MPAARNAIYNNKLVNVDEAEQMRDKLKAEGKEHSHAFRCCECGQPVRVEIWSSDQTQSRFEHKVKNEKCRYSAAGHTREVVTPDIHAVTEGYIKELKVQTHGRDKRLADECKKKSDFTCLACTFRKSVNGRFIIDAHHLTPVSLGLRETEIEDLVALCPTCHRIAHTEDPPMEIARISSYLE